MSQRITDGKGGFHPFQGRPPFGHESGSIVRPQNVRGFPSLSGKTSIRTERFVHQEICFGKKVSIPFREDLHSDIVDKGVKTVKETEGFPSLSGKTSIRTTRVSDGKGVKELSFHPFQGRPPFGLRRHSGGVTHPAYCFHPFQGRPPFGHEEVEIAAQEAKVKFPSLSGKTSIRTESGTLIRQNNVRGFPSLSGKTSIRTFRLPKRWKNS